jgi:gamma-aminobutyrate permease
MPIGDGRQNGVVATGGLAHTLLPRHVAMISLGGIIGAGLFVGSSTAIAMAGPAVIVSYAIAGLIIFFIMRMLGEMAVARPGLGSFAEYAAAGLGHWAGFMTGWLYWYFWVITVGFETIAGAALLHAWIAAPTWLIGFCLIAGMTASNLMSVRAYGEFEFWFAALKITAIGCFIVIGLAFIFGFGPGPAAAWHTAVSHGGLLPKGVGAVFAAIPTVIFSMMGSEIATIAAAETADPAKNVARAARTVSLRILIFYVASMAVIVAVIPWNSIVPGDSPFTRALAGMHVPGAAVAMSAVAITAVLSCLNSGLYITSRMLHELARRGDAPILFAAVSASKVPRLGILFGTLSGFLAALADIFYPDGLFEFLLDTSGAIILFIYLLIAAGEIRLRQRLARAGHAMPLKMWLFPWLSYGVIGMIAFVLVLMAFTPGLRAEIALSTLSTLVIGACFFLRRRFGQKPAWGTAGVG